MVEIAVEELQFDLDLINLLFAEPAMEDGYVGDANGGTSGGNSGDSKPASSDPKDGNDKKGTSDSTANNNNSDDKKDDDKKDEKKKDGKVKLVDCRKYSRQKVLSLAKKSMDEMNAKLKPDEPRYTYEEKNVHVEDDGRGIFIFHVKQGGQGDIIHEIVVKAKDGDPENNPQITGKTTDDNKDNLTNLQELSEDELKKKFSLNENTKIYGFKENGTVMYAHDKKEDQWYKCTASINPAKNNKTPASPEEIKMYNVNKHRSPDSERGFGEKIESFFKMIWELIDRAIAKIKEKLARCTSGQKTFAKEIDKIIKAKKKPNMDIKVKNYLYDDSVIEKLNKGVDVIFGEIKEMINDIKDNPDQDFDADTEDNKKWFKKITENPFMSIAGDVGIQGEIGGAGDFFNAVRRMYRGSEDVVEFKLSSRPNELETAKNFVKSYDTEFNKILNKIDKTKKEFEPFKRTMDRLKNANKSKDNFAGMEKILNMLGKQYTVVINCYSFMASLLQERVYNCRNLFRRAYGAI